MDYNYGKMIPHQITTEVLKDVHERIFSKEVDNSINVLLCGANPESPGSMRALIHKRIEDDAKFNVVFPESIFSNLLFGRRHNLLTLEKELAEDVDAIVLPLEGYGTMAELGAFTSFPEFAKKVVVINKDRYKHQRSFINMGPIGLIRSENKKNLIYTDNESNGGMVDKVYRRLLYFRRQEAKKDIRNLFTLSRFLLYLVAVFQPIRKEDIEIYLKKWNTDIPPHYVDPGLEILREKGNVKIDLLRDQRVYVLTGEGHRYFYETLLGQLGRIKELCRIRSEILSFQNTRRRTFDFAGGREKLLEAG